MTQYRSAQVILRECHHSSDLVAPCKSLWAPRCLARALRQLARRAAPFWLPLRVNVSFHHMAALAKHTDTVSSPVASPGSGGPVAGAGPDHRHQPPHPRARIGPRLTISFVALVVGVMGTSGWVLYDMTQRSLAAQMRDHLIAVAQLLSTGLSGDVVRRLHPGAEAYSLHNRLTERLRQSQAVVEAIARSLPASSDPASHREVRPQDQTEPTSSTNRTSPAAPVTTKSLELPSHDSASRCSPGLRRILTSDSGMVVTCRRPSIDATTRLRASPHRLRRT